MNIKHFSVGNTAEQLELWVTQLVMLLTYDMISLLNSRQLFCKSLQR
jgi:hypothetical protein